MWACFNLCTAAAPQLVDQARSIVNHSFVAKHAGTMRAAELRLAGWLRLCDMPAGPAVLSNTSVAFAMGQTLQHGCSAAMQQVA
jgi:hypothetical protein